jgi:protein-disulfide isomerase
MTSRRLALIVATALAPLMLTACGSGGGTSSAALPKVDAPAGQSWSTQVRATRDGFVMGNPNAPIKLVEYASPTCSHCAEFSTTSHSELASQYIDSGRVSLELRPFMLNPMDLVISTIADCGGTARFFPLMENVYATQPELITGIQGADQAAAQAAIQSRNFSGFANAMGISRFFAARGMAAADIDRCLADPAKVVRWQESTERNGREFEITGTPTFLLNGSVLQGVGTWEGVRDALKNAGAR